MCPAPSFGRQHPSRSALALERRTQLPCANSPAQHPTTSPPKQQQQPAIAAHKLARQASTSRRATPCAATHSAHPGCTPNQQMMYTDSCAAKHSTANSITTADLLYQNLQSPAAAATVVCTGAAHQPPMVVRCGSYTPHPPSMCGGPQHHLPYAACRSCSQRQAGWFQQDCTPPPQIIHGVAKTGCTAPTSTTISGLQQRPCPVPTPSLCCVP